MSGVGQQINLYQPVVRAGRVQFSSGTAAVLTVVVTVCMIVGWGYGLWRVERLQYGVNSLRQQQQHQQDTMASLNAARELGTSPEQIDTRVKELSLELTAHSRALELLHDGSVGQTGGFSKRLAALAGHPVGGLWIDHVVLSGITRSMTIGGAALNADLIPRYLRGLGTESALTGTRFGAFLIERPVPDSPGSKPEVTNGLERTFKFQAQADSAPMAAKDPIS